MANDRLWIVCDAARTCVLFAKWDAGVGWCPTGVDIENLLDSDFAHVTQTLDGEQSTLRFVKETSDELVGYVGGVQIRQADDSVIAYQVT